MKSLDKVHISPSRRHRAADTLERIIDLARLKGDLSTVEDLTPILEECRARFSKSLRPIPKSLVGTCVGHHPNRLIFREIQGFFGAPPRLRRAHPATGVESGDLWVR